MMPDFDFGTECTVVNYFQTKVDAEASSSDFQSRIAEAGDDPKKRELVMDGSNARLRQFSSAKPGDTIFAIRKRDSVDWEYVKDWKQLSKKVENLRFVQKVTKVELLVGREKGEARAVPATLW